MSGVADVFDKELEPPPTPVAGRKPRARKSPATDGVQSWLAGAGLKDFYAYMPQHCYLYVPTRETWPAASVNGKICWPTTGSNKKIKPSDWLDRNRSVEQMVWDPNEPMLIRDRVMQVAGYAKHEGASVFNLYLNRPGF